MITRLVKEGEDQLDIIREVVAKSGAKESTIEKDIADMYPNGLPAETTDAPKVVEKVVYKTAVPEAEKGRIDPASYKVKEGEENHVHAEIEAVNFDGSTGKKKSVPRVQIFEPRVWSIVKDRLRQQGYTHVQVLHAPEGVNIEVK